MSYYFVSFHVFLISKTSTLLAFVFFAVFLFFYLVCSIASVLLPVSQPISGFMGSWGEISHCSTWSGSSIPWCSSCSPPSSVTWSLLRPLVCRFIISLASLLVFTYLLFLYLITYFIYNIYRLYFWDYLFASPARSELRIFFFFFCSLEYI